MAFQDYYEVLGIRETANAAAVRAGYLRLIKRHHPDISSNPDATAYAALLNEAYRVLSDPALRALFDLRRQTEHLSVRRSVHYYVAWEGGVVAQGTDVPGSTDTAAAPRPERTRRPSHRTQTRRPRRYEGEVPGPSLARLSRMQRERLIRLGHLVVEWRYLDTSHVCRCYRCGHVWLSRNPLRTPRQCPACRISTWSQHRLFHCLACGGIFESGDCYTVPTDIFAHCPLCSHEQWYAPSLRRSLIVNGRLDENGVVRTPEPVGAAFR